jgi:hypothetical protein
MASAFGTGGMVAGRRVVQWQPRPHRPCLSHRTAPWPPGSSIGQQLLEQGLVREIEIAIAIQIHRFASSR